MSGIFSILSLILWDPLLPGKFTSAPLFGSALHPQNSSLSQHIMGAEGRSVETSGSPHDKGGNSAQVWAPFLDSCMH